MTKRKAVEIGLLLMAVAAALTLVSLDKTDIRDWFKIPGWLFSVCSVIGFVLGIVGILLVVFPVERTQDAAYQIKDRLGIGERPYETKAAKRRDLRAIHEFGERMFGTPVSDLNRAERWFDVNRHIFWLIVDTAIRGTREQQIVGYYAVFPLDKAATDLLEFEQIDGRSFEPDHIIPFKPNRIRRKPSCIYVGGVAGRNRKRIRHFVMGSLITHLKHEKAAGVRVVYTRPVTKDGLRLVKKYKFRPVNNVEAQKDVKKWEMNHIYKYEFPANND